MPESSLRLGASASSALTPDAIKAQARELGFDLCGVASAEAFPELSFFKQWIENGYAGTMGYLPRSVHRRSDVRNLMPSARSVIVTGTLYSTGEPYSTERDAPETGEVARYAWSRDYHHVLTERLDRLVEWMKERHPERFDVRAFVDTGPVQERVYAMHAGLGWIGKNTCLINNERGSWLLLSAIVCSLPLAPDSPGLDQCGTCTLCLEACPTGAFAAPYELDARKCISYLTIEYRGSIPLEHRDALGNHIFGCDVCQEVCPWNGSPVNTDAAWSARGDVNLRHLTELWAQSDKELAAFIGETAMTRAGVRGLRRNLAIALGNSGDSRAADVLGAARVDDTINDPIVAEHAEWAKRKLTANSHTRLED